MYTKNDVKKLLQTQDHDTIRDNNTRAELCCMHMAVYGSGCPGGWRKEDILRSIEKYFAAIERAQRLKP